MEHDYQCSWKYEQEMTNNPLETEDENSDVLLGELGESAVRAVSIMIRELCERSESLGPKMRRGAWDLAILYDWMNQQNLQLLPVPDEDLSSAEGFEWHGEFRFDVYLWTVDERPSELELRVTLLLVGNEYEAVLDGLLWS